MKKFAIMFIIIALVIIALFTYIQSNNSEILSSYKPAEGSKEELYQDVFVTLLHPYIDKAIANYYKKVTSWDPWDVDILSIRRPNGYRTYVFIIKLEVKPYVGPHLCIGVDHLNIRVEWGGKVQVEKFEHIKSYELPPIRR